MDATSVRQEKGPGYIAYLLPARSIVFLLVFLAGAYMTKQELRGISSWWSVAASAVNVVTILFLVIASKRAGSSYRELINYRKGSFRARHIGVILLLVLIGTAGMYLAGYICYGVIPYPAPMMVEPIPIVPAAINLMVLPVTTALAEDGLYLGGGVNNIKNRYAAVIVPAFFYALQHCFIPTIFDGRYMIYRFISFLPLTLILCLYYYRRRDPMPIMIAHALLDLATAATILIMSVSPGLYEQMSGI